MKPKKLIRKFITDKLKEGEWEEVNDIDELNKLYALKVREELAEIQESNHKDIMEFVDLIQVAFSFARMNGFTQEEISLALVIKSVEKGTFGKLALNNLNPANPSNKLYFKIVGYTACLETTFSMEDMRKAFNEGLAIGQDELVDSDYTATEYDIDFNRLIKELNKQ